MSAYNELGGNGETQSSEVKSNCKFCENTGMLAGFKSGRIWHTYQEAMMNGLPHDAGICLTPCPCQAGRIQGEAVWKEFKGTPSSAYRLAAATIANLATMRQISIEADEKPRPKRVESNDPTIKIMADGRKANKI